MGAIHDALDEREEEKVKDLLQSDPTLINATDGLDNCPLHVAAYTGQIWAVELLLNLGADVDARGDGGRTPLHYAAIEREPVVANVLLKHDARRSPIDNAKNTPLYYSVQGQSDTSDVAKELLDAGATMDLNSAVWMLNPTEFRRMLKSAPNAIGQSPAPQRLITDAVIRGDREIIEVLLHHDTPINGDESNRPLVFALHDPAILKLLLDKGADVDVSDSFGQTIIEKAKTEGVPQKVLRLLQKYSKRP